MFRKIIPVCLCASLCLSISCKEGNENEEQRIETNQPSFTNEGSLLFLNQSKDTLAELEIELAEDSYEHQTGLMHRESMEENRGMLFVYGNDKPRPNFYMKNTYIPLDMIYINSNQKVVDIYRNAKAMDETPIPSEALAQYVLEVNSGMADKWNLTVGDSVIIHKN
ncbi:DUF192 domain-containing protein [Mesonia maritima]|uniref:DUF192 domain-containing protein n=1 Tax=Mesonia maritima TaxID=1793873 RepID=A0ABU1K8T4_9FLAO|nr:DUF192 domain-containing protein [Mesonia maritima]MDR6302017.1 hypothetical protein [Mesonia maritima]